MKCNSQLSCIFKSSIGDCMCDYKWCIYQTNQEYPNYTYGTVQSYTILPPQSDILSETLIINGVKYRKDRMELSVAKGDTVYFMAHENGMPVGIKPFKVKKVKTSINVETEYSEGCDLPLEEYNVTWFTDEQKAKQILGTKYKESEINDKKDNN